MFNIFKYLNITTLLINIVFIIFIVIIIIIVSSDIYNISSDILFNKRKNEIEIGAKQKINVFINKDSLTTIYDVKIKINFHDEHIKFYDSNNKILYMIPLDEPGKYIPMIHNK